MLRPLKENKARVRKFIQAHYSTARLHEVLAFAQDGKFNFLSCCCLIGAATADHALRMYGGSFSDHYTLAHFLDGAETAEKAYRDLAYLRGASLPDGDVTRRKILIPMLKAEIRRRERLTKNEEQLEQHAETFV